MCHRDEGASHALMQRAQLLLQFPAQLPVERGQRFIQQQQGGIEHQRARQRHALLLAAGQLDRPAVPEPLQLHQIERGAHPGLPLRAADTAHAQRKGDIFCHAHVREQRVALEHQPEIALLRRQAGDIAPIEQDRALVRMHEAGNRHQQRRLAGPGRPQQRQELARRYRERDGVRREMRAVAVGDRLERQAVTGARHQ